MNVNVTSAFVFAPQLSLPNRGTPAWRKLKTYPVCSASSNQKPSKPRQHRVERRPELVGALPLWLISFALGRRRSIRRDSTSPTHREPKETSFPGETETGKYDKHAEQEAATEKHVHELHKATTVAKGWQAQYERAQAEVMQLKTKCENAQAELSLLRHQLRRQAEIEAAAVAAAAAAPLPDAQVVSSDTDSGVKIDSDSYHKTSQALFTSLCISQTQAAAAVKRSRELNNQIIDTEQRSLSSLRDVRTKYEEIASAVETLTVERDAARSDSVKMSALALVIATVSLADWASRSPKLVSNLVALVSFHLE